MRETRGLPLDDLLGSWLLSLSAERKSPQTLKSYGDGVRQYLAWCRANDRPAVIDRHQVVGFIDDLLKGGAADSTARSRQLAVRRFSAWLAEEREIDTDPLIQMRPVRLDEKVVEPLTEADVKALVQACKGSELRDYRDEALVRLMVETGMRAGEVVSLRKEDLDLAAGTAIVRRGKGGKGRVVPFGQKTATAIDRYIRRGRRGHLLEGSSALWLGDRGKSFSYDALHKTLRHRAARAGVTGFHPHRLRHTAAHRWLAAGGSEGGLMAVAGWTRPDMLMRYTKAQASARAAEEFQRLNLGDI